MKPHFAAGGRSMVLLGYLAITPGLFKKWKKETLRKTGWSCTSNAARHAPAVDRAHGRMWLRAEVRFWPILPFAPRPFLPVPLH